MSRTSGGSLRLQMDLEVHSPVVADFGNRFLPPLVSGDRARDPFRDRFVALVALVAALTGIVVGSAIAATGDPGGQLTLGYGVVVLGLLVTLRRGANPAAIFWGLQGLTSFVFVASRALEDRLDWPLVAWLSVFPLLGVLFGGWRAGLVSLGVAALSGAGFWLLEVHPLFEGTPLLAGVSVVRAVSLIVALFAIALVFDALRAQALLQAGAAARARTLFLANMSHELRTPMNGVIGVTDLLLDGPLPDEVRDQLELIKRSGAQLVTLVNDILDLTRLESGRLALEQVPVEVRTVFADVVALLRASAEPKGLTLTGVVENDVPPALQGDPTRLRQVITNLVGNAVKFTSSGAVRLVARMQGNRLRIEVHDTGIGMSPEVLRRLFTPFEQADVSYTRRYGGSGLGLTISQRLVALMHGRLEVRSVEGQGSTFAFELPCQACALPPQKAPPTPAQMPSRAAHVLVVEDNAVNLHVALSMLKRLGCSSVTAHDGLEALVALEREPFDLVLMDCHMPNLDGFETTRRLRALDGPVAGVRVVALTASALSEELEQCRAAGMDEVLTKPLTLKALQESLGRLPAQPP